MTSSMAWSCAAIGTGLLFLTIGHAAAQAGTGCEPNGFRLLATRTDVQLGTVWELRQDCAHPDWPARVVEARPAPGLVKTGAVMRTVIHAPAVVLAVRAGDSVRLWRQEQNVRIEMTGLAEQGARVGDRIVVRIVQTGDDAGTTVQRIGGIVRGAGDVEMER